MNRHISLIGAPTDIGAGSRGASMGPEALRVAGIHHVLQSHGLEVRDTGNLSGPNNPWQPPVNGYRHLPEVTAWNRSLHDAVYAELQDGRMPIVLGGDHCLGIGSISAVARHCRDTGKKLRVLWLDAHADFNTNTLTPSGNIHGMPVACLCGHGPQSLTTLAGEAPAVPPMPVTTALNLVLMVEPRAVTAEMMTTAMSAAIRPYSMAVAPDSSDMNFETNLVMTEILLCLSERSLTPTGSSACARLTPSCTIIMRLSD